MLLLYTLTASFKIIDQCNAIQCNNLFYTTNLIIKQSIKKSVVQIFLVLYLIIQILHINGKVIVFTCGAGLTGWLGGVRIVAERLILDISVDFLANSFFSIFISPSSWMALFCDLSSFILASSNIDL